MARIVATFALVACTEALLMPNLFSRTTQPAPPSGFVWASEASAASFALPESVTKIPVSVVQRLKSNAPEAGAVFVDIGRGVGVAAINYTKVAVHAAVTCYGIGSDRLKSNAPEAGAVFVDIGRGVGVAAKDYCKGAAAMAVATYKFAAVETAILQGSKAAALKKEGVAAIARREEMQASLEAMLGKGELDGMVVPSAKISKMAFAVPAAAPTGFEWGATV